MTPAASWLLMALIAVMAISLGAAIHITARKNLTDSGDGPAAKQNRRHHPQGEA